MQGDFESRQAADDALANEITVLHIASRRTYGVPRIHAERRRLGRQVNRKRVARIMRERDIRGVTRRKRRSLTPAGHEGEAGPRPATFSEAAATSTATMPVQARARTAT